MITWILSIVSIIGNYFNCKRLKICFVIWIVVNTGWTIIDISNEVYSRAMLDIIQIGFCAFGFIEWRRKEYGDKDNRS